jgi:hypothetical protein
LNATPPIIKDFLIVLTGDLACGMADNRTGLKLPALEFKCDRLLTKFTISPDGDHVAAQRQDVRELLTQVSDPFGQTDESLESYAAGSRLSKPSSPGPEKVPDGHCLDRCNR